MLKDKDWPWKQWIARTVNLLQWAAIAFPESKPDIDRILADPDLISAIARMVATIDMPLPYAQRTAASGNVT